jgi:Glutathione peroxidase
LILEYILLYLDNLGQLLKGGTTMSIYDIKLRTIDFEEITMDAFKGKVLLIVNTASN